jgi:hypothetical protein
MSKTLVIIGISLVVLALAFLLSNSEEKDLGLMIDVSLIGSGVGTDFVGVEEAIGELVIANRHDKAITLYSTNFC